MKDKIYIHYDKEGDFLEIRFGKPTPSYYEDLGKDISERRDKKTNKVLGYAIFNVSKGREKFRDLELKLPMIS